ncbi:hypothetical protein XA68_13906 [Ophiocordyceps unilateralis]|uniref:N-acetylgalactosaminide beta-1,3-galactosyltransferase n=1 Tax=Ophiocordyceps unilateralis TaxID=268505 RepID=A0A2A9PBK1_OPHUN|nr:hypothetical protein XA68_13906 [Ophiocordyceps unilateralis]
MEPRRRWWWPRLGLWLRPWRILPLLLTLYCVVFILLLPLYRLRGGEGRLVGVGRTSKGGDGYRKASDRVPDTAPSPPPPTTKTKTKTTKTVGTPEETQQKQRHLLNNTIYGPATQDMVHETWDFTASPCSRFPDTDGILLVMKTGASEAYDKLPTQLLTSLQCLPDLLLFSDMEQQMGRYHLHDALDAVSDSIRAANKEFALYEAQRRCAVSLKDCTSSMEGAWHLDKYKFVNMALRTWRMRPNRQWYVFAEADSYVFWQNLVTWLKTRDAESDTYVGNVALYDGFPFAHGGSGYVVSGKLLRRLAEADGPDGTLATRFDAAAPDTCCGDVLLGMALAEVGARVGHVYPMFSGDTPTSLPFGPGLWCEPALTLHHMSPEQVGLAWQYEQTRLRPDEPILLRDLYRQFVAPHLRRRRTAWDNLSADTCYIAPDDESQRRAAADLRALQRPHEDKSPVESIAHRGPDACEAVCEAAGLDVDAASWAKAADEDDPGIDDAGIRRSVWLARRYNARASRSDALDFHRRRDCFQWRYHAGVCCTSSSFKLGHPKKHPYRGKPWISGWFVRGIDDWAVAQGVCEPIWREPVQ